MIKTVSRIKNLKGEITIPADKSISHRAVMFSSLAKGKSIIRNFSSGTDCHSTLNLFKNLGIKADFQMGKVAWSAKVTIRNLPSGETRGKDTLLSILSAWKRVSTRLPNVPVFSSKLIAQRWYFSDSMLSGKACLRAEQKYSVFPSAENEGNVSKLSSPNVRGVVMISFRSTS